MARVVIIGAGGVGTVVAQAAAADSKVFSSILLASRQKHKCEAIARSIKQKYGRSIQIAEVNAENVAQSRALLKDFDADVLIHVALPYQNLSLMEACLQAGTHYLDTANYEPKEEARFSYGPQWAYQDRFQKAGLTALLGCGFDPGVTGVFTAYAAKHYFDEIHELDIVDCNAGTHDQPFATNFNAEINIREITQKGKYYENGTWHETLPYAVHRMIAYPNIGFKKSYLIYHEELESLVRHFPSLQRARFWMTFSEQYLHYLNVIMGIGMGSIDPIRFQGQDIVPLQFLQAVLPKGEALAQGYQGETSIGCRIAGLWKKRRRTCYLYNNCSHAEAYQKTGMQAVSFTTGIPAVLGAKLLLTQKWNLGPGVFNVEQYDPDPFMEALPEAGLPWEEKLDIDLGMG